MISIKNIKKMNLTLKIGNVKYLWSDELLDFSVLIDIYDINYCNTQRILCYLENKYNEINSIKLYDKNEIFIYSNIDYNNIKLNFTIEEYDYLLYNIYRLHDLINTGLEMDMISCDDSLVIEKMDKICENYNTKEFNNTVTDKNIDNVLQSLNRLQI
jgi:hypothetical protein